MSELMDVLLADGQRISERRSAPPLNKPASRADQIIAEGDRRRAAYRRANPNADTAMVYGAQVGYLHAQVRILANECECLSVSRNPGLQYDTVLYETLGEVVVGYEYTPGEPGRIYGPPEDCHPGEPEEIELCEVWVNGREVSTALRDEVLEHFQDAALERAQQRQAKGREWDLEP